MALATPEVAAQFENDVAAALHDLDAQLVAEWSLMKEVLDFTQQSLFGPLTITKPKGLNPGVMTTAMSLITKACKTFRAIEAAARVGCGQDASVLLRSLLETTIALLWILRRDSRRRAIMYAAHEDQRKLVLLQETKKKIPGYKRAIKKEHLRLAQARVDQWKELISPADVDSVRKHWSGLGGLEQTVEKLGWPRIYVMYRMLSAFSHGSDASAHMFAGAKADDIAFKLLPGPEELSSVLPMSRMLLLMMFRVLSDRAGLGLSDQAKALEQKTMAPLQAAAAQAKAPATP
jgi:hypothetical protein